MDVRAFHKGSVRKTIHMHTLPLCHDAPAQLGDSPLESWERTAQ